MQHDLRCQQCNKLLACGIFTVMEIKCPRCKTLNTLRAAEHPTLERHRAPDKKGANYGHQN